MEHYELKSKKSTFGRSIVDGAYATMIERVRANETPNFLGLLYDENAWCVRDLFLIPRFAVSISAIHQRNPTRVTGRKEPWVGCTILLELIPPEARIPVVLEGRACPPIQVRRAYRKFLPLKDVNPVSRGWKLDVLFVIHSLGKKEFSVDDIHSAKYLFERLHPANRHIRAKIRQQLQVLRDLGLLRFLGNGRYRLT